jgi:enamine deaminase RidA (YjgF/YER057c/UK114 family)
MHLRNVNSPDGPPPEGGYSQAVEVIDARRTLYVSGQIPVEKDGSVPGAFGEQCAVAWANLKAQLNAADMTLDNLVKVTTYLADRRFADENGAVRRRVLGDLRPALTVVVSEIFNASWLLELEAIAVD